jgi:FkbM family methyltransferase
METVLVNQFMIIDTDFRRRKWIEETGRLDHDSYVLDKLNIFLGDGDIVDIGANIGTHTSFYLKNIKPTKKVYAFEPGHLAFKCLSFNCPNAVRIPVGLSDKVAILGITNNVDNPGANYLTKSSEPNELLVPTMPLDNFQLNDVSFMKIDVEGFEFNVLKGSENTIKLNLPNLWIEISPAFLVRSGVAFNDLLQFISDLKYYPVFVIGEKIQSDVLFVHESKINLYIDHLKNHKLFREFNDWFFLELKDRFNKINKFFLE